MSRKRTKPEPVRTVEEELLKVWKKNKRKKDAEKIVEIAKKRNEEAGEKIYPISKPTIEKALLYGHCLDSQLAELITEYFQNRNNSEQKLSHII